jgi:hypothetical protein
VFNEQFALEDRIEALAHRVVLAVSNRSNRRLNPSLLAAISIRNWRVMRTLIGMVNHAGRMPIAAIDRHVERIEHQLRAQAGCHCPTDNASAVDIQHDGNEQNPAQVRT